MLCLLWCLFVLLSFLMFGWCFGVSLSDCCWIRFVCCVVGGGSVFLGLIDLF